MESRTQLAPTPMEDFENGDFLMATKILTSRIRHDQDNYELYLERSICYHKLGNYQASLEDADAAVRLNPSDYNVHYQKSLALMRLHMFDESLRSALKAIELRAARSDTKMSDIFKLIKDHSNQMKIVRGQPQENVQQQTRQSNPGETGATTATTAASSSSPNNSYQIRLNTSGEPVDSTTDRFLPKPINQSNYVANMGSTNNVVNSNNVNSNLVISNCNNNQTSSVAAAPNRILFGIGPIGNKVTSSAISCTTNNNLDNNDVMQSAHIPPQMMNSTSINISDQMGVQCKASPFEWNIRRSERIFLHNTSEPGTSSPHPTNDLNNRALVSTPPKQPARNGSGSSISSANKLIDQRQYNKSASGKSRDETHNSHLSSEVDVEDTNQEQMNNIDQGLGNDQRKRVMVTPSSSMPATSQVTPANTNQAPRDDSYSSKYKRLRRDRERARRGTSKLCTIRPADLEELHKAGSDKRYMRVIAPIDGWLYSGQLSVDDGPCEESTRLPHYVVKLDGDSSGSSYLFTQETVLNDVIKEVRVKSVSDLRKGARICCYWSRTYKCLSTGVVTSRTFEVTKSLVSVKYDNGDLSALPLEDLRLLPPDYPKYMSNCDPLLLARNGDGVIASSDNTINGESTNVIMANESICETEAPRDPSDAPAIADANQQPEISDDMTELSDDNKLKIDETHVSFQPIDQDDTDDDDVIPPTNQAIDFITNEDLGTDSEVEDNVTESGARALIETKDHLMLTSEPPQMNAANGSRASSEENNFGVEYRPWVFEGPAKRSKRHGRTYRDNYTSIRRCNEVLRIGDSAELMPRDSSVLPFIAKIDGLWSTSRGEMRVRVRWYYRLVETEDEPCDLRDGENALFETDHFDENDVQSIWRSSKILTWTEYSKSYLGHVNDQSDGPKVFYLAGYYDPVRRIKHLRSDVKEVQ